MAKSIFITLLVLTISAGAQTGTSADVAGTSTSVSSDGQIAKVLLTVDESEVEKADIAIKKAKNKEVRDYAKMMVKHHRENKNQTKNLVKFTDRDDTALSKSLKQDAKDAVKNLKKESQEGFDAAYIQSQIDMHQKSLDLLDASLIPNAKAESMRTHLLKTRETVSNHLTEAKNLKTKLE